MKLFLSLIIVLLLFVIGFILFGKTQTVEFINPPKETKTVEKIVKNLPKVKKVVHKPGTRIETRLRNLFIENDLSYPPKEIAFYAIKDEKILEVWSKERNEWKLVVRYPILAASGKSGPKLKQGDKQVPEGIYKITELNPRSKFHLSMRVDYPNEFDRKYAKLDGRTNLGGDIYIHGKAQSIGCLAIGDRAIEELYLLAHIVGIDNMELIITPTDPFKKKLVPPKKSPSWVSKLYKNIESSSKQFGRVPKIEKIKVVKASADPIPVIKYEGRKIDSLMEELKKYRINKVIASGVILSLITILINLWIFAVNRKVTSENKKLYSKQELLQYKTELRKWADQVILKMTETALLCNVDLKRETGSS